MKTKIYEIKLTGYNDLKKVAICQQKAFPSSLSSKMGATYLIKMFSWFIANPNAFLHHIEADGKCIGYCGGMVSDSKLKMGSSSGMLQHSFAAAVTAIVLRPWLLLHPELVSKIPFIIKNVINKINLKNYHADTTNNKQVVDKNYNAKVGLVIIGVDPTMQGMGVGYQLLRNFENICIDKGIANVYLSVNAANKQAIRAYERSNWLRGDVNGDVLYMYKIIGV